MAVTQHVLVCSSSAQSSFRSRAEFNLLAWIWGDINTLKLSFPFKIFIRPFMYLFEWTLHLNLSFRNALHRSLSMLTLCTYLTLFPPFIIYYLLFPFQCILLFHFPLNTFLCTFLWLLFKLSPFFIHNIVSEMCCINKHVLSKTLMMLKCIIDHRTKSFSKVVMFHCHKIAINSWCPFIYASIW